VAATGEICNSLPREREFGAKSGAEQRKPDANSRSLLARENDDYGQQQGDRRDTPKNLHVTDPWRGSIRIADAASPQDAPIALSSETSGR
jgi:hypothetical protein